MLASFFKCIFNIIFISLKRFGASLFLLVPFIGKICEKETYSCDSYNVSLTYTIVVIILLTIVSNFDQIKKALPTVFKRIGNNTRSFLEILRTKNTSATISTLNKIKKSDKDGYLKTLLDQYMIEECSDLQRNMIVTTFSNYSELVTTLIDHTKKIIGNNEDTPVFITQNTVHFHRWFNFRYTFTEKKWIKYLEHMHNLSKDDRIKIERFMTFTTTDIIDQYVNDTGIDSNRIPFYKIRTENSLEKQDTLEKFKKVFDETYITLKNISSDYKDEVLNRENALDYFCLKTKSEILEWESEIKELIEEGKLTADKITNKGNFYKFENLRPPLFKITDMPVYDRESISLLEAIKKLFHGNSKSKLYGLFIDNLNEFYEGNKAVFAEDFFAIGIEDNESKQIDWKIILAALVDENLEVVKLFFLTKEREEAIIPDSSISTLNWNNMVSYIDKHLKNPTDGFQFKEL